MALLGDGRRVSVAESERDRHGRDLSHHPPSLPEAVVYPEDTRDVAAVLAWADERGVPVTAFGAGTSLEGHVIPAARRHLARPLAPRPHPGAPARGPARGRPGGRAALAVERRGRRARPLVPGRPGRGRQPRRHGRDERERHDDDPLRRHASARPRPRSRPRRRQRDPARIADGEDLRGLRPARPLRRLGGNAGRDHRADAAPARAPRARDRLAGGLPDAGGGLPGGDRDRRRGRGRRPARAPGRRDRRCRQRLQGNRVRRRSQPLRRAVRLRGRRRRRPGGGARARVLGGLRRARGRARDGGTLAALGGSPPCALRPAGGVAGPAAQVDGRLRPPLAARRRRGPRALARGRGRAAGVDHRARRATPTTTSSSCSIPTTRASSRPPTG